MPRSRTLAALAALLLAAAPAGAQPSPTAPPAFPDAPVGRLAREVVDVVNAGDSAATHAFFARHGAPAMERGRTPAWFGRTFAKLHRQSGGLDVMRVRPMPDGRTVRVLTRSRVGARWLGIEVGVSGAEPLRLQSVMTIALDDPTKPPAPWPEALATDADVAAAIRDRVRGAAADDRFSGVVLVARGDSVLVHEAVGLADRERGVANTRETRFAVMSVGKMFTGVAIAQLVERGRLAFDDTLAAVLPDFPNRDAARRIVVRDLLTHTAGVPDVFTSPRFTARGGYRSHGEMLPTFADGPLAFAPGTRFEYSNGGYATLGAIVERLSGRSYEAYLQEHVWGPAGMRHVDDPAVVRGAGRAVGYARFSDADPLGVEPRRPRTDRPLGLDEGKGVLAAFGGGSYTAEDLFRFVRALRGGTLLRPETVALITRGVVPIGDGGPVKYAYGFYDADRGGHRVVSHPGSNIDTGFDADVEMLWDGDWTIVVLSNYDAPAGMELSGAIQRLLAGRR